MKRVVPVLEWVVLLPLWQRVFRSRPLQGVFAIGTGIAWLLIVVLIVFDDDGGEPPAEGATAVTARPGAIAEAEHVRVILHEIADPWTSESPFQRPEEGRRILAFDVTIDFFDDDGTHNANPFQFKLTDVREFAYAEALRGPEPMLQAIPGTGREDARLGRVRG